MPYKIMKVVAMVPIKLNNERTPGKNTKCFSDGTPLVTCFLKTLLRVPEIDDIYVFCSNDKIKEFLPEGVTYLKRPEFLDTAQATPQNIIEEFMKIIDSDIYIAAHCTSPFVTVEHISECINAVVHKNYDSAFTAEKMQRLLWSGTGEAINFSPNNIPRTQDLPPIYTEVSAAYVFRKETFLKYRRRIGENYLPVEVSGIEAIDIDYPEDFEIADAVYTNIILKKGY